MKIGWFGLGKLGMISSEMLVKKGHTVTGYDKVERFSGLVRVSKTPKEAVVGQDFVFVAVQTPHHKDYGGETPITHLPNKDFGLDPVKECLKEINKYATEDTIVVLISTVLPGTTRREFAGLLDKARLIYNPYLIAMGTVAWDMVNPDMVIIGGNKPNDTDAKALVKFYKTVMENDPHYNIGTWEEAEATKIFYNTFISARLSLVNMIQDVAQSVGNMNVDVVTNSLSNAGYRITSAAYMKAGMGDGGPCHPRDNIALRHLAERLDLGYDLFDAIAKSREVQAERMAKEILKHGKQICFTSDTYKPGVAYTDGSYALLVQHYIGKLGGMIVNGFDHAVEVMVITHPTDHNFNVDSATIVFDPWRTYTAKDPKVKVIHYGNTRD
jgi:UDPglucose 6-dehydrogenase